MNIRQSNNLDLVSRTMGRIAGFGSAAVALIFAFNLFAPIITTHASEVIDTELSATVHTVASINLSQEELVFSIAPTEEGVFASNSVTATVNTNSSAGYELYMTSYGDSTSLTNRASTGAITSDFTGTKTSETMANNTWGYSLDNANFSAIPAKGSNTVIKSFTALPSAEQRSTVINFGVKVDSTLPASSYGNAVVFSVVAHEPFITIFDLTYMQQMTASACHNTTTPSPWTATTTDHHENDDSKVPTKTLIDARDGKSYTVSKLNDGQCWMTQNLALELDDEKPLTAKTTDLNSKNSWKPKNDSSASDDENWPYWSSTPMNQVEDHSYVDSTYGGYYNWVAATAGHNTDGNGTTVEDSICPKGWRLPVRSGERSYAYLFQKYSHVDLDRFYETPLNLKAAGYYRYNQNSNAVGGAAGWYNGAGGKTFLWTSTAADETNTQAIATYLALSSDEVPGLDTGRATLKAHGLSVRCVAR